MVEELAVVSGQLFRLANELRRQLHQELTSEPWLVDAGFRPPCIGVLKVIDQRGPVSQREISDVLLVDPSDLVAVLDILEGAGLIERRRDPKDRRRNAVVVTEAGHKTADRLRELQLRAETETLSRLDVHERRQLAELIDRALGA